MARIIVRVGGIAAIGFGAVAFLVGIAAGNRPAHVFIPWGVAYLVLGLLMIFAARKGTV